MLKASLVALCATAVAFIAVTSPSAASPPTGGGSQIVSPSVVATSLAQSEPGGGVSLDLLVLWRGTPGWFLGNAGSSATWSDSAAGEAGRGANGRDVINHRFSFGSHSLQIRFDRTAHSVTVQGLDVALGDANVVLVDDVDTGKPTIAGTRRVELKAERLPLIVHPLLATTPELRAFLRCDVPLPESRERAVVVAVGCDPLIR